jgi:ferredoxin/flavodoxin
VNRDADYRDGARISLLYHSGSGGTRLVAELLGEMLASKHRTMVASIHDPKSAGAICESDLLVFCFPTYYLKPSTSMTEFISSFTTLDSPRSAYIVATSELYTENCIRTCALSLKKRGIKVAGSMTIRAPGSDVTCLLPALLCPWLYRFERGFHEKLISIADEIHMLVVSDCQREKIPAYKWYTPFTQFLQIAFFNRLDTWRKKIRILPERCANCGACATDCDRKAWIREGDGIHHLPERCELCTRCIHRCPRKAIVLIEGLKDNPRLDQRRYRRLKEKARKELRDAAMNFEHAKKT